MKEFKTSLSFHAGKRTKDQTGWASGIARQAGDTLLSNQALAAKDD